MSCPRHSDELDALADGELANGPRERLQAHVVSCAQCRAELQAGQAVKARVAALGLVDPPSGFWERVEQRLDQATLPRPQLVAWRNRVRQFAPALVLLALVAAAWTYRYTRLGERGCQAAQLARLHHEVATGPTQFASRPVTDSRLGVLVEARTRQVQGKPVSQFVFQRGTQRISLFHLAADDFDPSGLAPVYGAGQVMMAGQWNDIRVAAWRASNGVVVLASEESSPIMLNEARDMLLQVLHQMPPQSPGY